MGSYDSVWMTSPNIKPGQPGYYHEIVYDDVQISDMRRVMHQSPGRLVVPGHENCSHGCVRMTADGAPGGGTPPTGRSGDHHRHAARARLGQRLGLLAESWPSLVKGQLRRGGGHHNRAGQPAPQRRIAGPTSPAAKPFAPSRRLKTG